MPQDAWSQPAAAEPVWSEGRAGPADGAAVRHDGRTHTAVGTPKHGAGTLGSGTHGSGTHDPALRSYVRALESLFVEVRGRGVQWSPEDGELAAGWYRAGVELPTVARALAERSAAWRHMHADRALPRSLSWVRKTVERGHVPGRPMWRANADDRHAPPTQASGDAFDLHPSTVVAGLAAEGEALARAHDDPAIARATRQAGVALKRLADHNDIDDLEYVLQRLAAIRRRLVSNALAGLGASEAARLRATADAKVPAHVRGAPRRVALVSALAQALDRGHRVALPWWSGWVHPAHEDP